MKDYRDYNLIDEIKKVDRQGALLLKRQISLLALRGKLDINGPCKKGSRLPNMPLMSSFTWFSSPQGHDYWMDINFKHYAGV